MRRYLGLKLMFAGFFVLLGSCGACAAAFPAFESSGGGAKGQNPLMTAAGTGFYLGVGLVLLGVIAMVVEVIIEWRRSGPRPKDPVSEAAARNTEWNP